MVLWELRMALWELRRVLLNTHLQTLYFSATADQILVYINLKHRVIIICMTKKNAQKLRYCGRKIQL